MQNNKTYVFKNVREGMLLAVVTCYMFFVYAPIELLFTNQDEFFFDLYILLPVVLVIFALAVIASILFFIILCQKGKKLYNIGLGIYFVVFICSYIQGNFLVKGLPRLDGEVINWNLYSKERIKCILVWCIVSVIVFIAYKKLKEDLFKKSIKIISSCMGLMLLITLIILGIANYNFEKKTILNTTTKDLLTMSTEQNFIILLLDAVDAQSLTEIIKSDPQYLEIFDDFTAYHNATATYPFTKHSIPYILSGVWYENEEEFQVYEQRAYKGSPLFNSLEEEGYMLGIYEADLMLDDEGKSRFSNVVTCKRGVSSYLTFARWQIQMAGFKYAPFDLKRICFVNPTAFNTLKLSPNGEEQYRADNDIFYGKICDEEIELTTDKCFKFIHIEGGHVPFIYDENVNTIKNGTYEDNLKACLTITNKYLDKLRDSNVYDNSVIIIMSDHGYQYGLRDNPILYIKGIDEKHDMMNSDAPISYEDLQLAYQRLLQGTASNKVFDWKEGDYRERRFLWYEYTKEDYMEEYLQKGHAGNRDTLESTGRVYKLE